VEIISAENVNIDLIFATVELNTGTNSGRMNIFYAKCGLFTGLDIRESDWGGHPGAFTR
jgi:hypothetical protein